MGRISVFALALSFAAACGGSPPPPAAEPEAPAEAAGTPEPAEQATPTEPRGHDPRRPIGPARSSS